EVFAFTGVCLNYVTAEEMCQCTLFYIYCRRTGKRWASATRLQSAERFAHRRIWESVDWNDRVIHVQREKRGIMPWVPILPEMESLLRDMQKRSTSHLLFPSPFDGNTVRDDSAIRHRLSAACKSLGIAHVTPHGLRSYFVTQA